MSDNIEKSSIMINQSSTIIPKYVLSNKILHLNSIEIISFDLTQSELIFFLFFKDARANENIASKINPIRTAIGLDENIISNKQ